jgi:hypothetical protein
MKWVLLAVAVVAILVLVPVLVGLVLPRAHTATRSVRLAVSAERAWEVIDSTGADAAWRSGVRSVERRTDGGREVIVEVDRHGQRVEYETVESSPPHRLKRRIATKLPYGGSWTWEVMPEGDSCRVRITEEGEIYNPFFRFVARFVMGYTGTIEKYLGDMCVRLGQPARIEP